MIDSAEPPEIIWRTMTPWNRRIRLARVVAWWCWGLMGGLGAAIVVLVASRLTPWASATTVALALIVAASFAMALGGWFAPLSPRQTAMIVDGAALLADRITTAWELRAVDDSVARLQRSDALGHLLDADPRTVAVAVSSRQWSGIVALLLFAATAWLAPNPMAEVLRRQAAERARIQAAASLVQRQADDQSHDGKATSADQAIIEQALHNLARRLERTDDSGDALAAVSQTEQQLRTLSPPESSRDAAAAQAEASAMASASATLPMGEALAKRDATALARATAMLQNALATLSPDERAVVAQALQSAANAGQAASSDSNIASTSAAFRSAGQALQQGDLSEAATQLNAVRESLDRQIASGERADSVAQATAILERARSTIRGIDADSGSRFGTSPGDAQPQITPTIVSTTSASSTGAGTGGVSRQTGNDGNDNNRSSGATSGQGQPNGAQAGGTGGRGRGGGQRPVETGQDVSGDRVFIPGQTGAGTSEQELGPAGLGIGADVPYQQVIGQYAQSAQEHLDRRSLPPEVRELVRDYFVGLEEGGTR